MAKDIDNSLNVLRSSMANLASSYVRGDPIELVDVKTAVSAWLALDRSMSSGSDCPTDWRET